MLGYCPLRIFCGGQIFFIKTTKFFFCRGSTIEVIFMTEEQKTAIAAYRRNGCGYKKIGQLLGVSENTVKTYCRRNGLGGTVAQSKINGILCRNCGEPVMQIAGKKQKKFCSDACRIKWWNHHTRLRKKNTVCAHCGKSFHGRHGQKYCSHACYVAERFGEAHVS